jgi:DNA-binding transcriptional regulator YdaS (Cro superfamily)
MGLGLERYALEAVLLRLGQSIEIAEPGVGHRPVGIEEALDGQILCEHLAEVLNRLGPHARLEPVVVGGVELFIRREHSHAVQLQPLP